MHAIFSIIALLVSLVITGLGRFLYFKLKARQRNRHFQSHMLRNFKYWATAALREFFEAMRQIAFINKEYAVRTYFGNRLMQKQADSGNTGPPRIPKTIWMLGFVSLFTDMSSEIVHSLLPLLLATGLGASVTVIGLIEGSAEELVMVTKVF